jgi:hypothetical protein
MLSKFSDLLGFLMVSSLFEEIVEAGEVTPGDDTIEGRFFILGVELALGRGPEPGF